MIQDDTLILKPDALAMFLILFELGSAQHKSRKGPYVEVKITQKLLMDRSGFSKNVISGAMRKLEEKKLISKATSRKKYGEFGANVYTLLNPGTGKPLPSLAKNFLLANAVQYVKIPTCVIKEHVADWSIANMSGSELRAYVSICWQANRKNLSEFDFSLADLKKLGGFSTSGTAQKALNGLIDKNLVSVYGDKMNLHDPFTGEPPHIEDGDPYADPANYFNVKEQGRATRLNWNSGDPETVDRLLKSCNLDPMEQNDGELAILCPYHSENTPSCFVNPKKKVFHCFGCDAKGTLNQLVMHVRGIDKGAAWKFIAESGGQTVDFHEPDQHAEAIYNYHDAKGKLRKQVLRFPGKVFSQRRPAGSGGWIWNADGVPPLLYDMGSLKYAGVVCVLEGEKDCESIKKLKLHDSRFGGGDVCATTSGNAKSWSDELADHLMEKRVVLLPDNDVAGERFRAEVVASLDSRGIEYRVVSFADAGAKDVSDFLKQGGSKGDLIERIGKDWVSASARSPFDPDDRDGLTITI